MSCTVVANKGRPGNSKSGQRSRSLAKNTEEKNQKKTPKTINLMRNSEPQTGDVKIALLSFFLSFFFHYGISPIIIYLSIFYHLWIDSSNVVVLLILPFAFVQL